MPATIVANVGKSRKFDVTSICHPTISSRHIEWRKWRLTNEGGDRFILAFLEQFSNREDNTEFEQRKKMTYCPAFAKNALKKVRNTIFSRAREITRTGGPKTYQRAVTGKDGGVDRSGSSMNYFMGVKSLEELLKMSIVGIYVDMPRLIGPTLLEKGSAHPYCYVYQAEQIRSWTCHPENPTEFTSLLLVDRNYTYDEQTSLPIDESDQYRFLYLKDTPAGPRVFVKFYNKESDVVNWLGESAPEIYDEFDNTIEYEEQVGELDKIPFVMLDIGSSLFADVANYQIAHLNIASSDIWFAARANFPFYTEAYDPRAESQYIRKESEENFDSYNRFTSTISTTTSSEITVGPTRGRKYPQGTERPAFIHPSPEPLAASMAKQDQMKLEIKELVDLTLQSLTGQSDSEGILSGLNYISYMLQWAENKIAEFWSMYEGSSDVAAVLYPETPEITDPKDVQLEITNLLLLIDKTPQLEFKKVLLKKIARLKLGSDTDPDIIEKIYKEIDASTVILGDPLNIMNDVNTGLLSIETACLARGYPKDEAEKAANDHAERLKRIQDAQTPAPTDSPGVPGSLIESAQARGIKDQAGNPAAGKQEKAAVKDTTPMTTVEDPTRGKNKDQS
jgi:hypothetical protein